MDWIFRAQVRAQMNTSRPEADSEYSRGRSTRRGGFEDPETRWQRRVATHRKAVWAAGWLGAALLVAAEFLPLVHVHAGGHPRLVRSITTGSDHSYALLPVAALAAALAVISWGSGSRLALLAIGVLGLLAIGIACWAISPTRTPPGWWARPPPA